MKDKLTGFTTGLRDTRKKLNIAVIFGGASEECDVSVISAQQMMDAVDHRRINAIPIYMDFENRFCTGPSLRDIKTFRPKPHGLQTVTFQWSADGPVIQKENGRITPVDCIFPVLHGSFGEDGRVQSYFELLGIPIVGFTATNSAIAIRKDATKALVKSVGVSVLDHIKISYSQWIKDQSIPETDAQKLGYPVIIKPANLGSSIGVGVAHNEEEAHYLIEYILRYDWLVLIEPKINNLCEFNIAILIRNEDVKFSAIEQPKNDADLLDFKNKYFSPSVSTKSDIPHSGGMISLSRKINPDIPMKLEEKIRHFAKKAFLILGGRGCPRIDFLYDEKTEELWFNEINAIPGSYAFFLWEAAPEPMLFPELIYHLINEALQDSIKNFNDPVPQDATLLQR
ncbi:MAG: hypothetical protein PSN37_02700 [Alphaproteobacteria bacterium]|nr:hypothetical protein [Alphaproteobacteria bacterium]